MEVCPLKKNILVNVLARIHISRLQTIVRMPTLTIQIEADHRCGITIPYSHLSGRSIAARMVVGKTQRNGIAMAVSSGSQKLVIIAFIAAKDRAEAKIISHSI